MELRTDNAYAELGLDPGASEAEVKVAWRRLASQWHPDRNSSASASGKMQRINQAIELIRQYGFSGNAEQTADTRTEPPQAHDAASHEDGDGPGSFEKAGESPASGFKHSAGTNTHSRTVNRKVKLTLEEAAAGCVKVLRGKLTDRCAVCAGTGYQVLDGACSDCGGAGTVRSRAWYGWAGAPAECTACRGEGIARQACNSCEGTGKLPARNYRINVRIPLGVRDGDLLHVGGRRLQAGHAAVHLDLRVEVLPHSLFQLDPDGTVHCEVPVNGFAWIANRAIDIPTLGGLQSLQLRREQLSYRLNGQGFPSERRGPRGDQVVTLLPTFPERLDTDQEILLDQLIASSLGAGGPPAATRLGDWQRALRDWNKAQTKRGR